MVEKETSPSKETTSSISYRKLTSRRRPGAYSNTPVLTLLTLKDLYKQYIIKFPVAAHLI